MGYINREAVVQHFTDAGYSILPNSLGHVVLAWSSKAIKFYSFDGAMRSSEFTGRIKKSFNNMVDLSETLSLDPKEVKDIVINYPKMITEPFNLRDIEANNFLLEVFKQIGEVKLPFPAMTIIESMSQNETTIDGFSHMFLRQVDGAVEILTFVGVNNPVATTEHLYSSLLPFKLLVGIYGDKLRIYVKATGYSGNGKPEVCIPRESTMEHIVLSALKCIYKSTINDDGNGCYISKPTPREVQVNRKKIAKRKVPLIEFRLIKIEPRKIQLPSMPHGTHASPRQHWRRGHWRTYASGKRVFVNPMLVGDEKNGKIIKDYVIGGSVSAH